MNLDYWTTNGLHAEITRLGRRVAELEAAYAMSQSRLCDVRDALDAAPDEPTDMAVRDLRERCDAAQRDAATLRGALEGLVKAVDDNGVWEQLCGDVYRANLVAAHDAARQALAPAPAQATSEEGR